MNDRSRRKLACHECGVSTHPMQSPFVDVISREVSHASPSMELRCTIRNLRIEAYQDAVAPG